MSSYIYFFALSFLTIGVCPQTTGRKVSLTFLDPVTPSCLVAGRDPLQLVGTVETSNINVSTRPMVYLQMFDSPTSIYRTICSVSLTTSTCRPVTSPDLCYCHQKVDTLYTIHINKTALDLYSRSMLRLRWPGVEPGSEDVSTTVTLPEVVAEAKERLLLDNVEIAAGSAKVVFPVVMGHDHNLTYCLHHMASHIITLLVDGQLTKAETTDCLVHNFKPSSADVGKAWLISASEASGCLRKRNISITLHVTGDRETNLDWWIIFVIVLSVLVALAILTGAVIKLCHCSLRKGFKKKQERNEEEDQHQNQSLVPVPQNIVYNFYLQGNGDVQETLSHSRVKSIMQAHVLQTTAQEEPVIEDVDD